MSVLSHLKIRDLELVVALHEEGSVTQAAKRIGISEPAFSKRIQLIERQLKAQLFERGHDGAKTTNSGFAFIGYAAEIIHTYHRAIHEAQEAMHGEYSKLCIGVSAFMPPELIEFLRSIELPLYRDLAIEIDTAYSAELLTQLRRGHIDLALVTSPPEISAITTLRLVTNSFRIVFREGHPLTAKQSTTLAEVAEYPWVFFNRNIHPYLHDQVLERVAAEHKQAKIAHHFSYADQATALLTDNALVAWMSPPEAQRAACRGLCNLPLLDEHLHLETHLATHADNKSPLVSEYVRRFVKRMEQDRPPEQLSLPIA
jgi:DNA-binding transcriptional LysR family regulator